MKEAYLRRGKKANRKLRADARTLYSSVVSLDKRQRTLVDLAAKARWPGRHEGVVC